MFIIWKADNSLYKMGWALSHLRFTSQQKKLSCAENLRLHKRNGLLCSQVFVCEPLE